MTKEKPNKEQMQKFEDIRYSGVTNMFDVSTVVAISGGVLTREVCYYIMDGDNYTQCMEEYGIVRRN